MDAVVSEVEIIMAAAPASLLNGMVTAYEYEDVVPDEEEVVVATVSDIVVRTGDGAALASEARVTATTYGIYIHAAGSAWRIPLSRVGSIRGSSSFLARYSKILLTSATPVHGDYDLRFSFHGSGYKNMLAQLESTFKMRLWVGKEKKGKGKGKKKHRHKHKHRHHRHSRSHTGSGSDDDDSQEGGKVFSTRSAGVSGIMRRVEREKREEDATLDGAFDDLESLMVKAREVVQLAGRVKAAQDRAARSRARANNAEEDAEETDLQDHLMSLGLGSLVAASVSKEASGSASVFHMALARELARFLAPILADESTSGVLPLTDAYCLYNRARGTDLVSPDDVLAAAAVLGTLDPPAGMEMVQYPSGIRVIQSSAHSADAVMDSVLDLASASGHGVSALELSQAIGISILIASQHLASAEQSGLLCRDASVAGLYFWPNIFDHA